MSDISETRAAKAAEGLASLKRQWQGGGSMLLEKESLEELRSAYEQEVSI